MLLKIAGWHKFLITNVVSLAMLFCASGCHAMKSLPAERYFSANQLTLARQIEQGNLANVTLLAADTNLNLPAEQDMTLLFFALQKAYGQKPVQLQILSALVKRGADPLQQVPEMGSVAEVAARSDTPVYMNALLEGGMSPDAVVADTPIVFDSASAKSFRVLKLLVSKGANINQTDSLGQTVLIEALAGMQLDQVEWLLQQGANPSLKTVNGWQFGNMLEKSIQSEDNVHSKTGAKLEEIRTLAVSKGMQWPPASY